MDRYDHRHETETNRQCVYGLNQEKRPAWVIVNNGGGLDDALLGEECRMDHVMPLINVGYEPEDTFNRDRGLRVTITEDGMDFTWQGREEGNHIPAATDDAKYLLAEVIPDLLERFLQKNAKYARAQVHDLGIKGIVPDINRKSSVIIDRVWHGAHTIGEDTEEVIDDLIGHLLLMRAKMRSM